MQASSNSIKRQAPAPWVRVRLAVCLLVWLGAAAPLALAARASLAALSRPARPSGMLDEALAALAAIAGLAVLGWLALATGLVLLSVVLPAGGRAAAASARCGRRIAPAWLHRTVFCLVGAAVVTGASPAGAATVVPRVRLSVAAAAAVGEDLGGVLDPGWAAAPPSSTTVGSPVARSAASRVRNAGLDPTWGGPGRLRPTATEEVVVRRGDCLWDIAARALGPSATDAQIAQAWPAWYAANRSRIGADPDLLVPGTRLIPPSSARAGTR